MPLMTRMIVGLAIFFFVASLLQLFYLHWRISRVPESDLRPAFAVLARAPQATAEGHLAIFHEQSIVLLELHAMEQRYHQANVLLMSRVWTRYLGFVTGMILALVGAVFVLGKLEGSPTSVRGEVPSQLKYEIQSSSPGIILGSLGVILMMASIVVNHRIEVHDKPIYLSDAQGPSKSGPPTPENKPALQRPEGTREGIAR